MTNYLFTDDQLKQAKSEDKLPLKCNQCTKTFFRKKHHIQVFPYNGKGKFCSKKCSHAAKMSRVEVSCKQCEKQFKRTPYQMKKSKNYFCSSSCAASFNNTHKSKVTRRSKLEIWLEAKLKSIYQNLVFEFNKKDAINSELDIYIPSLKLAFELNGIFHYEPIFGEEKLSKIKTNDGFKFQRCIEKRISLCVIDVSSLKYFKESNAVKYLNIITEIINKSMELSPGVPPS